MLQKPPAKNAAKAFGKGAAEDLKPSYAKASACPAIGWVLAPRTRSPCHRLGSADYLPLRSNG